MCKFWSRSALVFAAWLISASIDAEPLKSIGEIWNLDLIPTDEPRPVEFESQVVWVDEVKGAFFIYDGDRGIYVYRERSYDPNIHPEVGDIVAITGYAAPGGISPAIEEADFRVVGHEPLPEAKVYSGDLRESAMLDCEWMKLSGRLVSMRVFTNLEVILVEVVRNNYTLNIKLPYSQESVRRFQEIMLDVVEVDVVAGSTYNTDRQLTGRIFFASSADDFVVVDSQAGEFQNPDDYAIGEFMGRSFDHRRVVRSEGVVTAVGDREIYLQDGDSSVQVSVVYPSQFGVGNLVSVEGFVVPGPVSPGFLARKSKFISRANVPSPTRIDASVDLPSRYNYDLVKVDAVIVDIVQQIPPPSWMAKAGKGIVLMCRAGDRLFEARLPRGAEVADKLTVGSTVELTGICHLIRNPDVQWTVGIRGFWLQLRDIRDIKIIAPAPWWTAERAAWVVGGALGLSALFFAWILLLHRTVERQTKLIGEKIEQETLINERQRVARELHDNLDQGLTGAAVHLRASRKFLSSRIDKFVGSIRGVIESSDGLNTSCKEQLNQQLSELATDKEKGLHELGTIQSMLTYCGRESRSYILELRGGLLEKMDLPAAVDEVTRPLVVPFGAELAISTHGSYRRLRQDVEWHLLMVVRESVANAMMHGQPKSVSVVMRFEGDGLQFSVSDDGQGFDLKSALKSGRLGIQGMKERMNRLGGVLDIESEPGKGTEVIISVDSFRKSELN
ncbi:MAG: sensor histidine kinase [Verrucomicrobiota bacterium]